MSKYIYNFNECNKNMKDIIGDKGAIITEIKRLNIPVEDGLILTPELCREYNFEDILEKELNDFILESLIELEEYSNTKFGDANKGFFLEIVNSLDYENEVIPLNIWGVGLNDKSVNLISQIKSNPLTIWEEYRRYILKFAVYGLGIKKEELLKRVEEKYFSNNLSLKDKKTAISRYKDVIKELSSAEFPQDSLEQLLIIVKSLFNNWESLENRKWLKKNERNSYLGIPLIIKKININYEFDFCINMKSKDLNMQNLNELNLKDDKEIIKDEYYESKKNNARLLVEKLESHFKKPIKMSVFFNRDEMLVNAASFYNVDYHGKLLHFHKLIKEGIYSAEEVTKLFSKKDIAMIFSDRVSTNFNEIAKDICQIKDVVWPGVSSGQIVYNEDRAMKLISENKDVIYLLEKIPEKIGFLSEVKGIICKKIFKSKKINSIVINQKKPCYLVYDFEIDKKTRNVKLDKKTVKEESNITVDGLNKKIYAGILKIERPTFINKEKELLSYLFKPSGKEQILGEIKNIEDLEMLREAEIFGVANFSLNRYYNEPEIFRNSVDLIVGNSEEKKSAYKEMKDYYIKKLEKLYDKADGMELLFSLNDKDFSQIFPSELEMYKELRNSEKRYEIEKLKKLERFSWNKKFIESKNSNFGINGAKQLYVVNELFKIQAESIFSVLKNNPAIKIDVKITVGGVLHIKDIDKILKELENSALLAKWNDLYESKVKIGIEIDSFNNLDMTKSIDKRCDYFLINFDKLIEIYYSVEMDSYQGVLLPEYQVDSENNENIFVQPSEMFIYTIIKKIKDIEKPIFLKGKILENSKLRKMLVRNDLNRFIAKSDQIYNLKFSSLSD